METITVTPTVTPTVPATPAATPAIALSKMALLVDLDAGVWGARKKDEDAAREIAQSRGGEDDYFGAYVRLLGKDALKEYNAAVGAAIRTHERLTMAWSRGVRIVSTRGYPRYLQEMQVCIDAVKDAAERFLADYDAHINAAVRGQGSAFNRADYPTKERLRARLTVKVEMSAVPDAGNFLVEWPNEALAIETEKIRAHIAANAEDRLRGTVRQLADRVRETVGRMSSKLREYRVTEDGVEGAFRDSLVENVRELVDLIPTFKYAADPEIDRLAEEMRAELLRFSPDTLRLSEAARSKVAAAADAIVSKMDDFI